MRVAPYEYVVTAILREDRTVDLSQTVTRYYDNRSPHTFGPSKSNTPLRTPYGMAVGNAGFLNRFSLAK